MNNEFELIEVDHIDDEEATIASYIDDAATSALNDLRYEQFMAAKVCGPYMEVCPHCGEELWLEFGYWNYYEMLLWEGLYYHWDMPISHYRDI
jgi:hypothetical protein